MDSSGKPMRKGGKALFVIGDRILVAADAGEQRTKVGLLLPPGAVEKEAIQSGRVTAIGPGTPLPPPGMEPDEPWKVSSPEARYLPMPISVGDSVVFFRKAAVEISFEGASYLVVPHAAVLVLVRDQEEIPDSLPDDL